MSTAAALLVIAIAADMLQVLDARPSHNDHHVAKSSRHRRQMHAEGENRGRMMGGTYPDAHTYKYMASLNRCGGTLISANWVVTAAHCLRVPQTQIVYGTHYKSGGNGGKTCSVKRTIPHPQYNRKNLQYDVALIELNCTVTTDSNTAFATLAPESLRDLRPSNGLSVWTAGWGQVESGSGSERLMHAELHTVDVTQCQQSTSHAILSSMMCAYSNRSDSCYGDSGGPLMYKDNDRWVLAGIVSFGTHERCAQQDQPGVYHYLPTSIDWIRQTTAIGNDEQPPAADTQSDQQSQPPPLTCTAGVRCFGHTSYSLVDTVEQCSRECANDSTCQAVTFQPASDNKMFCYKYSTGYHCLRDGHEGWTSCGDIGTGAYRCERNRRCDLYYAFEQMDFNECMSGCTGDDRCQCATFDQNNQKCYKFGTGYTIENGDENWQACFFR